MGRALRSPFGLCGHLSDPSGSRRPQGSALSFERWLAVWAGARFSRARARNQVTSSSPRACKQLDGEMGASPIGEEFRTMPNQFFRIFELTALNASAIEQSAHAGDDNGGIAVTPTRIFVTGDTATAALTKDLSSNVSTGTQYNGIVSDLASGQLFTLGTS